MPTTRKKVIKTVYKDEDDSAEETGDFSDSGSEAKISGEESSSDYEEENDVASSGDEFVKINNRTQKDKLLKQRPVKKPKKFAKIFINKISKQSSVATVNEDSNVAPALFSVKDLTDADKLLPSILNLSESDSSDDESPKQSSKSTIATLVLSQNSKHDTDDEVKTEYKDVWSQNMQVESEEIARKAFLELEKHKSKLEETKAHLHNYTIKEQTENEVNVQDLLAQGEDVEPQKKTLVKKKARAKKIKDESDSDVDDWEEVQESKAIPQQGLQLVVELPDSVSRKTKKKIDVEMMIKRRMNRVKKKYQVYMHKVHVLCWIGHGNHVSKVLNDQELLSATLSLVPSKECYPGERVDMKYLEQITTWYKDKLTLKQDKNENKFRPKALPLKEILLEQIKSKVVTTKKYLVFIFVAMLRALGLQCRVMFNFVTLPIKPPSSELCSLSNKSKEDSDVNKQKSKASAKDKEESNKATTSLKKNSSKSKKQDKISQVDGNDDSIIDSYEKIMQVDGNDDTLPIQTRKTRAKKAKIVTKNATEDDVSPPKRSRKSPSPKPSKTAKVQVKSKSEENSQVTKVGKNPPEPAKSRKTRSTNKSSNIKNVKVELQKKNPKKEPNLNPPKIVVTKANQVDKEQSSKYFSNENNSDETNKIRPSRKRALTTNPDFSKDVQKQSKNRTKSAPGNVIEKSKYFDSETESTPIKKKTRLSLENKKSSETETKDKQRISHKDLAKQREQRAKPKNDVKGDLINIIKGRVKEAKQESKKGKVKGKSKPQSDEDSDFLPEETTTHGKSDSDDEFKPTSKISPRPKSSSNKKIDRRVISSSESETPTNKIDVWCEVFVEELEQWISVNVVKGIVHCAESLYSGASHPVCYVVGWDNNNYLKDVTRRYVPHWNTVTRKQRAEPAWWARALGPWLGPRDARDREENEQLDRMQLEAPLPKSISEYKNHPLYALKRHLLKFEVIYPPDAATLGFVRGEPVYARECVYTCRSRDVWLKEAKVVRLREEPYKVVTARPKWDRLSNKLIKDRPLEVFGPWQVQDYEPPTAENGIVPRNAYGNVELFKACMLPKGTVHIKLPGLNKVAKKLNIDCAPAMTGFDYTGGYAHPAYDGFVVCKEFEDIITEAWAEDQEDQERKEIEKTEARVYGNWRRLIKGLLIRERLKKKYGFQEPSTSKEIKKNTKGPRLVVKKK